MQPGQWILVAGVLAMINYRADIDGLRAISVLAVFLFHAAIFPFGGGYVGVDVFFVISGYLISGIILSEQESKTFSFANFYERRIRRIVPALALVLAATTVAAFVVLLSDELFEFGQDLTASVLFVANMFYWHQATGGYFAPRQEENLLLHLWSLSVEEQFYLVWPILLVTLSRWRASLPSAILVLAVLSFAAALAMTRWYSPPGSFFLFPTRAWQLLAGAFLATGTIAPSRSGPLNTALYLVGLVAILFAGMWSGPDKFPGWNSVLAVAGAMSVLYAGRGTRTLGSRILGSPVPRFIGRISYSLYLWHWPVLVFARMIAGGDLPLPAKFALLGGSVALATASWFFVERPLRRLTSIGARGFVPALMAAATAGIALAGIGVAFYLLHGVPSRLPASVQALEADAQTVSSQPCSIGMRALRNYDSKACMFGHARQRIILWGDSFADALRPGLMDFAARHRMAVHQVAQAGCPPLPTFYLLNVDGLPSRACIQGSQATLRAILTDKSVGLVVLHSTWDLYMAERGIDVDGRPVFERARVAAAEAAALSELVNDLTAHGLPVLIIGSVPMFQVSPMHCMGRARILGRNPSGCATMSRAQADAQLAYSNRMIQSVASRHSNVRAFLPQDVICGTRQCDVVIGGHLIYRDRHHLDSVGARIVGRAVENVLGDWPAHR